MVNQSNLMWRRIMSRTFRRAIGRPDSFVGSRGDRIVST